MSIELMLRAAAFFLLVGMTVGMSFAKDDISPGKAVQLRAGPIRLKFQDGELRYINVGDKEIVRRIYFGVRDPNWNTAMPKFTTMQVDRGDDHFTINLAADCRLDPVFYQWTGTITGTADGKISFHVEGAPAADFDSNRIG